MSDGYELKDGEVVEMANPEIVPAGGASLWTDDVITGGMNYNVARAWWRPESLPTSDT
ncbi:MAG: hypothetical protein ACLUJG_12615 [Lawsonibacter sp.]